MNSLFQRLIDKATQLTRKGDLKAATAAIQAALAGKEPVAPQPQTEAPAPPEPTPAVPEGRFVAGSYADASGQRRDYKLYMPPAAGERALPLIVMLHGCTQNADDFAAGTAMNELARAHGFFVLYPEQSPQANPQRCWNWFK